MANSLEHFHDINCFIFDVDGVFTDGSLLVTEKGDLLRTMNAKDGYSVRHAVDHGYKVIIITGGTSEGVKMRLQRLGVEHVFIAVQDKLALLEKLIKEEKLDPSKSIYMGDDLPDLAVMQKVKIAACPQDAVPEVIKVSQYISSFAGGDGCVRDIIETTLKIQDNWL